MHDEGHSRAGREMNDQTTGSAPPPELAGRLTDAERQAIQRILGMGYRLVPADGSPPPEAAGNAPPTTTVADLAGLGSAPPLTPAELKRMTVGRMIQLWQAWDRDTFRGTADFYRQAADRAIKLGEPLLAFDVLKAALKLYPDDVALRQTQAVALSRSGVVEEATKRLQRLLAEGHEDEETLGNLARTLKDRWEAAGNTAEARRLLEEAFNRYEGAYRHPKGGYWTGINAATLAACLDR